MYTKHGPGPMDSLMDQPLVFVYFNSFFPNFSTIISDGLRTGDRVQNTVLNLNKYGI